MAWRGNFIHSPLLLANARRARRPTNAPGGRQGLPPRGRCVPKSRGRVRPLSHRTRAGSSNRGSRADSGGSARRAGRAACALLRNSITPRCRYPLKMTKAGLLAGDSGYLVLDYLVGASGRTASRYPAHNAPPAYGTLHFLLPGGGPHEAAVHSRLGRGRGKGTNSLGVSLDWMRCSTRKAVMGSSGRAWIN
jgi:hypothetical protein